MALKLLQSKKYKRSTHVLCPSCNEKSTVEEWNDIAIKTYGENSPDIRHAALDKKISFPFQCPKCYMGYSAYLVKLVNCK
ncbi:hypothetical protein [Evansella cellulosilytica]|uniref:Uncharacterized protein n=1 Tax=Evansella cellulosilytica (strain ATCC 21833 / DSM 2522 / FERM P-1141 / JCM 9156 / N-4) TaxID=649639 RepID=E6TSC4_EVAC2|nr:hypothetical protein [Evansella cellulosilytica]ADU31893.1 hypothetical protein Bcell_3652 [Evansella cellulosilytica DSM 2522]